MAHLWPVRAPPRHPHHLGCAHPAPACPHQLPGTSSRGAPQGPAEAAVGENLPSMGVLGSGRLANTTSTYSNCSRSREAFRPGGGDRGDHHRQQEEGDEARGAGSCRTVWGHLMCPT